MVTLFVPEGVSGAAKLGSQSSSLCQVSDRTRAGGGTLRLLGVLSGGQPLWGL